MTTGDLLEDFAGHMQLVGYSPRTEQERLKMLQHLARVLAPRSLAEATRRDLERFLTSRPLKPESRRAYRAHLRAFYRWCLDEGHVTEDPSAKIPAIRVPRGLPRPITTAEIGRAHV